MFNLLTLVSVAFSIFNPTVKLNSGKQLSLVGSGPPVVFSSGLFGTMPRELYGEFISNLKKNVTILSINNVEPISKKDITDIADSIGVDSVSYISHSSFNPEVLESDRINKAILIDPICLPKLNIDGINSVDITAVDINVDYPIKIFKAEKLYTAETSLPIWQNPTINGVVVDEIISGVGHPDILDDLWADVAKKLGLWKTAEGEVVAFKDWKFKKSMNNIKNMRKQYRDYISQKCLNFINTNINDVEVTTFTDHKELEVELSKKDVPYSSQLDEDISSN
tara:strand:+ start:4 stop:843 length:840 start_codon:yes stop_codon:yes gene_type:complete